MLEAMARAKRFNGWMADTLAPYVHGDVLEIGAGIGNLTALLCSGRRKYVAAEIDEEHLSRLEARLGHCPNVNIVRCDIANPGDVEPFRGRMETVVCLNVLEHIPDDVTALRNMYSCLQAGGRALILVPQGMSAFGALDKVLGHQRRYSKRELATKMREAGFGVEQILEFNRITYPGWFFNGRVLRRRTLSVMQLQLFDRLVPFWKRVDRLLPWPPTSIIGVGIRER